MGNRADQVQVCSECCAGWTLVTKASTTASCRLRVWSKLFLSFFFKVLRSTILQQNTPSLTKLLIINYVSGEKIYINTINLLQILHFYAFLITKHVINIFFLHIFKLPYHWHISISHNEITPITFPIDQNFFLFFFFNPIKIKLASML